MTKKEFEALYGDDVARARWSLERENELLIEQLHQVEDAMAQCALDGRRCVDELAAVRVKLREATGKSEEHHRARTRAEQEVTRKDAAIGALEARVAAHEAERASAAQAAARVATLDAQVVSLRAELAAAREAGACEEAGRRSVQEENALLLQQLAQVQEELEHCFVALRAAECRAERDAGRSDAAAARSAPADAAPARRAALPAIEVLRRLARRLRRVVQRPDPQRRRWLRLSRLVDGSRLFDRNWYLQQYPDVRASGMDPLLHYLRFGWNEGRNPCPNFDSAFYLTAHPDVAASGINPLVHFICHGRGEGRAAHA